MSKIRALRPTRQIGSKVTEFLTDARKRCVSGEITDIAVVVRRRNGDIQFAHEGEQIANTVGAIEYMKSRILKEWDS